MDKRFEALTALGWSEELQKAFDQLERAGLEPGRVAVEDKHHYSVQTVSGEFTARISGKLEHVTKGTAALPKVGDWVAVQVLQPEGKALIHHVLPRKSRLSRKVPGRQVREQVLVTNVDIAFVVQALDSSFNPGLLQRHLVMAKDGGVKPVVVLNKTDLCSDILDKLSTVEAIAAQDPVIAVSAKTGQAMDSLTQLIRPGQTVVFVGPSGVGKSSLINQLYGEEILPTTEVRESDAKGRHTTSWREMIQLPGGGLVIDTPGMREFQTWLATEGAEQAFADIEQLALSCHFRQCSHTVEKRCAVREAVERGEIRPERLEQYLKLKREMAALERLQRRPRSRRCE